MIRAEITNFESIDHAVIEVDGFTTVQGPNYSGKSAAMRAINAALVNLSGTEFISWGKTFCEVHLQTEGLDLLWHKEEGNNFYEINGTKYTKTGKDEPPSELSNLGYGTVRINGVRHNLHFADQFNPLFLVNQQSTKNSDLIASAYGLDRLYKASELCSKDQKASESLLKIRNTDLEFIKQDLKKFDGLDDVIEAGSKLKLMSSSINELEGNIKRVKQWAITVLQTVTDCNRLKPTLSVVLPSSELIAEENSKHHNALELLHRYEISSSLVSKLSSIESCQVPPSDDLVLQAEEYTRLVSLSTKVTQAESGVEKLSTYKDICLSSENDFSSVGLGIENLSFLKKSVEDIVTLKRDSEALLSEKSTCVSDLDLVEKERATYGNCPLCGSAL